MGPHPAKQVYLIDGQTTFTSLKEKGYLGSLSTGVGEEILYL